MPVNCSSQDKLRIILIPTISHQDPFFYDLRMRNLFIWYQRFGGIYLLDYTELQQKGRNITIRHCDNLIFHI